MPRNFGLIGLAVFASLQWACGEVIRPDAGSVAPDASTPTDAQLSDAVTDAGALDGGEADDAGGASDGASEDTDSGVFDAGLEADSGLRSDSGALPPDASTEDAGFADAGLPDAAPPADAGFSPDAAPADSGPSPDAGFMFEAEIHFVGPGRGRVAATQLLRGRSFSCDYDGTAHTLTCYELYSDGSYITYLTASGPSLAVTWFFDDPDIHPYGTGLGSSQFTSFTGDCRLPPMFGNGCDLYYNWPTVTRRTAVVRFD